MIKSNIKYATIYNLEDIERLENGFTEDRYSKETIADSLNNEHNINLLIECNGKIIGYLSAGLVVDECEIYKIIIDTNFRKMGYGTQLINYLISTLNLKGIEKIFLEVRSNNIPAKKLYEKIGFVKIYQRQKYYSDGIDADIYWYILNDKN